MLLLFKFVIIYKPTDNKRRKTTKHIKMKIMSTKTLSEVGKIDKKISTTNKK